MQRHGDCGARHPPRTFPTELCQVPTHAFAGLYSFCLVSGICITMVMTSNVIRYTRWRTARIRYYLHLVADKVIIKAISENTNRPNSDVRCIIVPDTSRGSNTITSKGNRITSGTPLVQVPTYICICIACWLPWKYLAKDSSAVGTRKFRICCQKRNTRYMLKC